MKEELEHKLEQAQEDKNGILDNITELKRQLNDIIIKEIEAEKPKLQHGDFGYEDNNSPTIILRETQHGDPLDLRSIREGHSCQSSNRTKVGYNHSYLIFGNIFDLLKEWGEDLEGFEKSCVNGGTLRIQQCDRRIQFCIRAINDYRYATASIEQAKEIWRKLGQMIATLKRKENK